jgi:hypothetical protein
MAIAAAASGVVSSSVSQTGVMFAAVGVAFLIYITARGDLARWLGAFGLAGGASQATGASQAGGTSAGSSTPAGVPAVLLPQLPALPGLLGGNQTAPGSPTL